MEENRKFQRASASLIVRFRIARGLLGMSSRSEDISEGGIRLAALQRLESGMIVELKFNLQELTDEITTKGKVIWQSPRKHQYFPFLLGIQFIGINPVDRNRLHNYVGKIFQNTAPLHIS